MSELQFCRIEKKDAVLVVTLHRPEVLNALHREAHLELTKVFDDFTQDANLRVAIITGSGERAFCVGSDLKAQARDGYVYDEIPEKGFAGLCKRLDLNKPVIAAVNGAAIGGGMETVIACDLAIAVEHAVFSIPEPKVGKAAIGGGGLQRLVRQLPFKYAMKLILTGEKISASEAQEIGLINEVVPKGQELDRALELAQQIIMCAPLAIEASKAVVVSSLSSTLERSILDQHPATLKMLMSNDSIVEGPTAFSEKRSPCWQGK